jgi:hypothetical protein
MNIRSHREFSARVQKLLAKPIPCPQCGCDLPLDQTVRQAHFAECKGKPAPKSSGLDLSMLSVDELKTLHLNTQTRLTINRDRGASELLLNILTEIVEAADKELAAREGAK